MNFAQGLANRRRFDMRRSIIWGIVVAMVLCLSLVLFNGQVTAEEKKYVIGVAQPTFNHPIRQAHFWAAEIFAWTPAVQAL